MTPDRVEVANVRMWGRRIGAVAWDGRRALAVFEYDPEFLEAGLEPAPLMMPVPRKGTGPVTFAFPDLSRRTFLGLPGMLADALPDRFGNRLIDAWLARQGRSPDDFSPIERLCYVGRRAMGTLEFEPPISPALEESVPVEVEELVRLAGEAVSRREALRGDLQTEPEQALLDILRVGTSAGGMRPKAVVALDGEGHEIRSGQVEAPEGFDYWILKLDGVQDESLGDPAGYGRIEYAYHLMAIAAGIQMTECRLLEEGARAHFLTRRFDRSAAAGRIHLQSLCALAHYDFNDPGAYAYEQAFQVLRRLGLPYEDTEQLFRRMVFNVAARNLDDHAKNIAFLMDRSGTWRLSPAFDVIYAHNPDGAWTSSHQMSVNGKTDGIGRSDLEAVAREMGVSKAPDIITQVCDAVAAWPRFAEEAGVERSTADRIAAAHRLAR